MYTAFAQHFHETRHTPWPGVVQFLMSLPPSRILDLGCGNGKYLGIRKDCQMIGCDPCASLVSIAQSQHPSVDILVADGCSLPFQDTSMEVVLSVAVFHHIAPTNQAAFLGEVRRVLQPQGIFFATVWAPSAIKTKWTRIPGEGPACYRVPWNDKYSKDVYDRYYYIYTMLEIQEIFGAFFDILEIREECKNWYIRCRNR